jgi:amino acid permease
VTSQQRALDRPGRQLTFWEATFLTVGAGVGAGIMAVPYLAEHVGFGALVAILGAAYVASSLVHLLLAEVLFRTGRDLQVVELMRLYVFRGRFGPVLLWTVFAFLGVAFLANLAAYVSASGEIVTDITGLPDRLAELVVYACSAGVVFFGLKAVGVFERFGALALFGLALALGAGALGVPFDLDLAPSGAGPGDVLAVYGVAMYGYYTFFSVPQVVKGLAPDRRAAVRAILAGLALNGVLMLVIAGIALGVSSEVTKVAITGIADAVGPWAGTIGSLFILVALVTSYWSVSLALADIIAERTAMAPRLAWLLATLPSLLVLYVGVWQFLEWLRLAAGLTAIVIALIALPMYRTARRIGEVREPEWQMGRWGSPAMLVAIFAATVLMAIGAASGL